MNRADTQLAEFTLSTLEGDTLTPSVYNFNNAVTMESSITLQGDRIYIFQIGRAISTAAGTQMLLQEGAQACNVFWVADVATIGASSTFVGTMLSKSAITVGANSITNGRMLAQTAVTVDAANTQISCLRHVQHPSRNLNQTQFRNQHQILNLHQHRFHYHQEANQPLN